MGQINKVEDRSVMDVARWSTCTMRISRVGSPSRGATYRCHSLQTPREVAVELCQAAGIQWADITSAGSGVRVRDSSGDPFHKIMHLVDRLPGLKRFQPKMTRAAIRKKLDGMPRTFMERLNLTDEQKFLLGIVDRDDPLTDDD